MIRVRTNGKYHLPKLIHNSKYVRLEDDNRFITIEEEKKFRETKLKSISGNLKEIAKSLWAEQKSQPKFRLISIETSSGCNQTCKFCPVNKNNDPRPPGLLPDLLLEKICNELERMRYSNTILLFGNNEPLLDDRIVNIINMFRKSCPDAYIKLLTNGLLIDVNLAFNLFTQGLSTLTINNYSHNSSIIIKPVMEIIGSAERFDCLDLRISLRDLDDSLTNRCGEVQSSNDFDYSEIFCNLPFVDLNITYTGNVSFCCFDSLGKSSVGNINKHSLQQIWYGSLMYDLRKGLFSNRSLSTLCSVCDFDGFRDPMQDWTLPLTREDLIDK